MSTAPTTIAISLPQEQVQTYEELLDVARSLLDEIRGQSWMREEQAAAYLSVSQSTFRRWVKDGWLRSFCIDGTKLYNRQMLDEDVIRKGLVQAPNAPLTRHAAAPPRQLPNGRQRRAPIE